MKYIILIIAAFTAGCTTVPDMRNGVLVDDWYEPSGTNAYKPYFHMCKYANGVVVNVGFARCL